MAIHSIQNDRNHALDGLRGICALAVMLVHFSHFNGMTWFKNAGAGVDAFFIISGFVICQRYQARIRAGYPFLDFLKARVIRLAPLNALGAFLGLLTVWFAMTYSGQYQHLTFTDLTRSFALTLGFLPDFNQHAWPFGSEIQVGGLFPLNLPAWSLFLEMGAYLVFFFVCRFIKINRPIYLVWVGLFLFYAFQSVMYANDNPGWDQRTLLQGIPRVLFGFFTGAVIQMLGSRLSKDIPLILGLLVSSLSVVLLLVGDTWVSLVNSFVFMPITIVFLASLKITGFMKTACTQIGELSFPLYIIHVPIATLLYTQFKYINAVNPIARIMCLSLATLVAAFILNQQDKKIRAWLNAHL